MREIKFRAWDTFTSRMIVRSEPIWRWEREDRERIHNDYVLMQFTGLKDKNGKDIYEGDIVKFEIPEPTLSIGVGIRKPTIGPVIWKYSSLEVLEKACRIGDCEVIGNIYENPERLK
jgi:hypothetical protein